VARFVLRAGRMLCSATNAPHDSRQPAASSSSPITSSAEVATDRARAARQEPAIPHGHTPSTDAQWESVIDLATD
jgi:hypothetical protein